ncbi:RING finger protein 32 isoform X2 [Sinocyclocheilus anshuiensis]|uniref:RING finger protein 32 isoform X2 n=1 Tax=Sinocyclocheilus anshuiensis TaxID=1608454 RepID=UPI0007B9A69A|nr:PREDICTED: RING finger protein 32 isoform X2 [Sinocyclocheilus anshuiensis]
MELRCIATKQTLFLWTAMPRGFGCKAERGRLTLAAVALQDHITRSVLVRNIPRNLPVSDASCGAAHVSRKHRNHNSRQSVICPEQTQGQEEREYVLDRGPPPLTLAQRMGLVAAPSRRLTAEEWAEVKTRSIQEGDSTQPCVICREEFRLQPQVLLSCSHVFHKVCLKSFEKFSGRKSCPMCRTEQYETRVIYDGARLYREKCAVRIQAFWRGYLVRKWYSNIKKYVPPKDQQLRRVFFEKKAVQRGVQDCPICLNRLGSHNGSSKEDRNVLLLSCSHLFHEPCLQAFELFCHEVKPTCPLCRSHYAKMLVSN